MLECWVWQNEIYFYVYDTDQKLKLEYHPLLIPTIPFFHHSTIPMGTHRKKPPLSPSYKLYEPEAGVESKSDPLGQDSLLSLQPLIITV